MTRLLCGGTLLALNENGTNAITRSYDGLNRVTSYTEGGNRQGRQQGFPAATGRYRSASRAFGGLGSSRLPSQGRGGRRARQRASLAPTGLQSRTQPGRTLGRHSQRWLANRLFTALGELEAAILEQLEPWRRNAQLVRQLLGRYSIVSSANACGRC